MFGMGGSEIIVILIVALLFLGPEKLPNAAKSISKGIRDIKKQSRALQQQIESDEQIGGAIRDLKSALRGEDVPSQRPRYQPSIQPPQDEHPADADQPEVTHGEAPPLTAGDAPSPLTLPPATGEPGDVDEPGGNDDLAAVVKPAAGTVAKGS